MPEAVSKRTPRKPRNSSSRPATLADVARLAGVVPMTASRALNRSGYVSEDVRARVLAAAETVRYRPNIMARQLRSNRMNAIGIMLPDIANPFYAELVRGIQELLIPAGYTGFIATASRGVSEERSSLEAFLDHRVDGLIIATRGTQMGDEVLRDVAGRNVSIVTIGRPGEISGVDSVTADHQQGAFDAVSHLVALGHKRIAFLGAPAAEGRPLRRYAGYLAALERAGLASPQVYSITPENSLGYATEEEGYTGLLALAKLPEPPTAVFARNDYAAIGALRAAHTLKLRVPQDIAIAGFDNIPIAAYQTPPLTTVEQPIAEQGRAAADLLLKRVGFEGNRPRETVQMPCTLIVRESTAGATA